MSTFKLNVLPGVNDLSKAAFGIGNFSPTSLLNKKPEKIPETTGLLSKGLDLVPDKLLKLIFFGLSIYFSILRRILRRFIPSFIKSFLIFAIPSALAFYEIPLRGFFPRLPSVFSIAFRLYQRGFLTMETVIWLASSLPASFLGGLGALGGVAMQTTAFMAGGVASAGSAFVGTTAGIASGAASAGSALVGTATGIAGNASKSVAQGMSHLNPVNVASGATHALSGGAKIAADRASSITTAGVQGASALAEGTTNAVAGGLFFVKNGLNTGENGIALGNLVPDVAKNTGAIAGNAVGATKAAVTENATKLANVLDGVNPLNARSQDSQSLIPDIPSPLAVVGSAKTAATESATKVANALDSVNPLRLNILSKGSESSPNSIGGLLRPKLPGFA